MSGRLPGMNQQGASGVNAFNVYSSNSGVQFGSRNVMNVPVNERVKKPKKPLSQSEREPNLEQMDHITQKIDKYKKTAWKELGQKLGLSQGEIETVEHDFHYSGVAETCYQMLRKWKERQPTPPQIKVLAKALCDIGRGDLSDYLA